MNESPLRADLASQVEMVALVLIVAAFLLAVREHRLARPVALGGALLVPCGLVAALFSAIVIGWVIQ